MIHKDWVIHRDGMLLMEKYRGPFWNKKRYYFGWAQNAHNMQSHGFHIEADWFDTLPKDYQLTIYQREYVSAYKSSMSKIIWD